MILYLVSFKIPNAKQQIRIFAKNAKHQINFKIFNAKSFSKMPNLWNSWRWKMPVGNSDYTCMEYSGLFKTVQQGRRRADFFFPFQRALCCCFYGQDMFKTLMKRCSHPALLWGRLKKKKWWRTCVYFYVSTLELGLWKPLEIQPPYSGKKFDLANSFLPLPSPMGLLSLRAQQFQL